MCKEVIPAMSGIACVILAGGRGTRLNSVVSDRPKVLAQIKGRPFLTFLFDRLVLYGIQNVVLCTGYMADRIRQEIGGTYKSLKIIHSPEDQPLGTAGAVHNALKHVRSGIFLLMNGDSFVDVDLIAYLRWFHEGERNAALLLTPVKDVGRYGRVTVADDGSIMSFEEKEKNAGEGLINAGVYIMKKAFAASVISGVPCSLEKDILPKLIGSGLYGYHCHGRFIDIGTPESYRMAEELFADDGSINEQKGLL
jgi:NDP-sugar pyrophosphorylase family protein